MKFISEEDTGGKRFLLIREEGKDPLLVAEGYFEREEILQETFKKNPELIPTKDLGLTPLLVVGREVTFPYGGSADLLAVDGNGEVVIVEFKKGQPITTDARRVIAQCLEYGAHLWNTDFDQFEKDYVLKYFNSTKCHDPSLKEKNLIQAMKDFWTKETGIEEGFDESAFEENISKNLADGKFIYLVISTQLDDNLKKVMQYINFCSDLRIYGIEIDYFKDETKEIFVPRSIVSEKPPKKPARRISKEDFLQQCDEKGEGFFKRLLDYLETTDNIIYFGKAGFSFRVLFEDKIVTILQGYPEKSGPGQCVYITFKEMEKGISSEIIEEFKKELAEIPTFEMRGVDRKTGHIDPDPKYVDKLIESIKNLLEKLKS